VTGFQWAVLGGLILCAGGFAAFALILGAIAKGNDDLRAIRIAQSQAPGAGHARLPIAGEDTPTRLRPAPGSFDWARHERELKQRCRGCHTLANRKCPDWCDYARQESP